MVAPLLAGSKVKGVMAVWRTGGVPFSDSDLDFLVGLSLQATVAIENARLFAESEKRATELATINTVSQQLGGKLELAPLLDLVGEQIRTVFNADVAYVALYNPDTGIIDFPYQYGDDLKPIKFGEGLTSRIIQSGKALIINHEADRRGLELGAKVVGKQALSYLGVPIPVGGASLGVISVQSTHKEGVYGADDERLLSTIAANVGVALQNARLFNETQEALSHQTAIGRHPARDQQFAHRRAAGVRRDRRHRAEAAGVRLHRIAAMRRQHVHPGRVGHAGWRADSAWGTALSPVDPASEFPVAGHPCQGDAAHSGLDRDRAAPA